MLIDLHTHTRLGSPDSVLHPDELIERSKAAGLDAIVLSEHDQTWAREDILALGKRHNFVVIPGLEVTTDHGHILVYGLSTYEDSMRDAEALAGHVERANGAMVAAHPYRNHAPLNWHDADDYQRALDRALENPAYQRAHAIEVLHGHARPHENRFSELLAAGLGRPGTAGTDSHFVADIGKAATYFERDIRDEHDLVREILAGRCWAVDLTAGRLTEDPARHTIPGSISGTVPSNLASTPSAQSGR